MHEQEHILTMRYIIVSGELLLYTPVIVRSNRIPPPCVFATQDSTRKDSTQTFNIKSRDDELAHIRAREVQTHIIMAKKIKAATANAAQTASVESSNDAAQTASANAAQTASATTSDAAQAQTVATPLVEGTVKKFTVKVMRVQLFENEDIVNVQLTLNKVIPGFIRDDDDNYVAADVDHISLSRSALTRVLCEKDEMIATMRDGQANPLTRAQLSTILHGAIVVIARTYHVAGYTAEGRAALVRDQWFTDIESVKLTDLANNLIQQLVMQRMMNE